ncbi:2'-5' RNA ligase family protein [Propionibacterium cyclohexanicum]|uniref:2'-5' RNA ligase family protein n=1 Tax=Propionibacterium cyclohexanicum TaxID=64702 RepID=UPI001FE0C85C|nr:2'-5' RNA ligase family protein [Propionibacterium cyclohexanicum]
MTRQTDHPCIEGSSRAVGRYGSPESWRGHAVLEIPVPQLEPFVRARTAFYDPGFVSADPRFCHAHITLLAPFDELPERDAVARAIASMRAFDFRLADFDVFSGGMIYLRPQPLSPFRQATASLLAAFPQVVPYGGPDPVPHLSLDVLSATVSPASTRRQVGDLVPARCQAESVDLCWYESGACRLVERWQLSAD